MAKRLGKKVRVVVSGRAVVVPKKGKKGKKKRRKSSGGWFDIG